MNEPFFSVIICTYNRASLLPAALISLSSQIEKDWEAIIVDDGSNDDTFNITKGFCNLHTGSHYIYHSHSGLGYSRNRGLFAAKGKYITFLDSDDEYKLEHLSLRKYFLLENPNIDLLHGGVEIIGNPFVPDKNDTGKLIHLDECVIGGTFFVKRGVALKLGGFGEQNYADDSNFYDAAQKSGYKITKFPYKTYIYHRDTPDSICNTLIAK